MSELGDEPDIQDVNSRGIVQGHAPSCRRSSDEVGVVHLEFTPVHHEDDERGEWARVLKFDELRMSMSSHSASDRSTAISGSGSPEHPHVKPTGWDSNPRTACNVNGFQDRSSGSVKASNGLRQFASSLTAQGQRAAPNDPDLHALIDGWD
jgi:hypothetical protein